MKITMPKNYKSYTTLEQMEYIKTMRANIKEYYDKDILDEAAEDLAKAAASIAGDAFEEVLKTTAEAVIDAQTKWDYHGEGCGRADIFLEVYVKTYDGFIIASGTLCSIWSMYGDHRDGIFVTAYGPKK